MENYNTKFVNNCNGNIDFCKIELKKKYSGLNVKYTNILHDNVTNNTNGTEIYKFVNLSKIRFSILFEKYQKYIGVDDMYISIKQSLDTNIKLVNSFSKYANQ